MGIKYNGGFCVSVFENWFEQVRNTFMKKLSEKYEVHICIRIKDLDWFLLILLNLHTKIKNAFDKHLYGNKLILIF